MTWQAFAETFRAILRDRAVFLLLIVSPLLYSFFYPSAYSGEVAQRIPVAIVDYDHSATSRSFVVKAAAVQQASVAARPSSGTDASRLLQEREVDAFVIIPPGFEADILRGGQGRIALYGNGAFLLRSSTSLSGLGIALGEVGRDAARAQAQAQGAPAPPPLQVVQRPLFNTREGYGSTVVPGVVFVIIQQTMIMGMAMLAATVRERRGDHAYTPSGLLGTALAYVVIGMASVTYYTGFVFWFQDYPRGGADLLVLAASTILFVLATVSAALALASFFHVRERPIQLWIVTSLPIYFLSGLSWPIEQTPAWLSFAGRFVPTTPGIHLMVGTNQMGASIAEQWPELLNLAGLVILYSAIAYVRLVDRSVRQTEPR